MKVSPRHIIQWVAIVGISLLSSWLAWSMSVLSYHPQWSRPSARITASADTTVTPVWPNQDPINPSPQDNGIAIPLPKNIKYHVEYNPETGLYEVSQKIGDRIDFRNATQMTMEEYMAFQMKDNVTAYWKELVKQDDEAKREFAPSFKIDSKAFENIFGSNEIEFRPQGSAELTFGLKMSKVDNPRIPERQRRVTTFDFDQKIQLNVTGNVGTRMKFNFNYNTESQFDFENQMKLGYTGDEDQIIKKIELGTVQMPLSGSLIQGSSSLFGAKVETQWGKLKNTTVISQQKGERKEITVQGGAQTTQFDIPVDNYEANRHYFLSGYFRDGYDNAMKTLPVVNSGAVVTRIEVWVVNQQANTQDVRNILAFSDLGEPAAHMSTDYAYQGLINQPQPNNPDNDNNDLYSTMMGSQEILGFTNANPAIQALGLNLRQGIHYERVGNARKLNASEFTYNTKLGFVSLKQALNNAEVLAVAYEYTLNGQTFQVGTLSQDGIAAPQALVLKMLKSSITMVKLTNGDPAPLWQNMMKNVYNLGAFGVSPENFRLDVWYNNPATGVNMNSIQREPLSGKLLLQLLDLDRIDNQQMPYADAFFDFVPNAATQGGLIDAQTGRIFFPHIEPFGQHLENEIVDGFGGLTTQAQQMISQVVFNPLYDSTKTSAQINFPQLNRFRIKGQYQSASGSDISLNAMNIPQGSVSVTSGSIKLVEGQDFTVDYNLGRVKIINEGVMSSGNPIKVSVESNSLFNMQFKTMLGSRFDYKFNDKITVGSTFMNLRERPLTQKVNIGDEPVNNWVVGADVNYQEEIPFLTEMVDRLPFIKTKAKSTISFNGEAAKMFPGHSKAISKIGNSYIDDFEGSQSVIDLRTINQWFLASTPKMQQGLFPEGNIEDSVIYNYNRARLSWYVIDPLFYRNNALTPPNVDADMQSDHRMREVLEAEVFPNRQLPPGTPPNIATLDLTYYPEERGPYNYDTPDGVAGYSSGLSTEGLLNEPETRWGGIQRALTTTDFEMSNVQFIQFWVMDPFNDDSENTNGGDLYFNLGNVSEDVLNDSHLSFENGYPTDNNPLPTLTGSYGIYPNPSTFNVVNAFDNTTGSYEQQDIGLDGLNSAQEQNFFSQWLSSVQNHVTPESYVKIVQDPSADDFRYFRGSQSDQEDLSTLERYKRYNGYEGNANTSSPEGYPITATTVPNTEDINQDITLNQIESYFQYKVSMRPGDLGENNIGSNYITDSFVTTKTTADGEERSIRWYQFKVPIKEFESRIGNIPDFRSIRYIRMFLKGWKEPVTLRFARLELVRGEWRKLDQSLLGPQELEPNDDEPTEFDIAAVNIEENGNREPVPYAVPPGIIREQDVASANLRSMNEQSLAMSVCNLNDGDAKAAYRNVTFDMRQYKRLRMFAHIEAKGVESELKDKDLTVFVRLGSDFDQNYYEYEMPMSVTPWFTNDDTEIWPEENNFDIVIKDLQDLKASRPAAFSNLQAFTKKLSDNVQISVKGNPNISNVTVLMIGVRNPDDKKNVFDSNDDGKAKCAIVWVNELRLSEFDNTSGWAAIGRLTAQVADIATVNLAGNISTPGWGSVEQKVQQRQQETKTGVDASTTVQMGKFFPENWGVQMPLYMGFSENVSTPRYSPLQPDLELAELPNLSKPLKKKSQTMTRRRSVNVTNVKIVPKKEGGSADPAAAAGRPAAPAPAAAGGGGSGDEPKFYSIDNFSVSYAYNEIYFRDINIDFRLNKQYTGGFDYAFNNKPKEIKPFAKIPLVKTSPYLKWVKEFNFYPGIKQVGFHTDMNRTYETSRIRNNTLELTGVYSDMLIQTQAQKNWSWNRNYNIKYDLTKSIKMDFVAANTALIVEPRGVIQKEDKDWYEAYKDTVSGNIMKMGESTMYNHQFNASYKLPLDKFPLIDFVSSDVKYSSSFRWDRAPFTQDTLGHRIQNSRNLNLNATANFETLYNKVPRLKEVNQGKKDDKKDKGKDANNPDNKDGFGKDLEKKEKKEKINWVDVSLRFLMMVRNANVTYAKNEGMMLPGYNQRAGMLGQNGQFSAPGLGFAFGQQNTDWQGNLTDRNFAVLMSENGYLVNSPYLNNQYTETATTNWSAKASIEPIKYLKIELTANRQDGRNLSSFFRYNPDSMEYQFQSPLETGNFSASINTWSTAFARDDKSNGNMSEPFTQLLAYREVISARLNEESYQLTNPEPTGFYQGYGGTSQDVVIPAFIAAYTGKSPEEVALNPFKTSSQPNWKVSYDGFTKLESVKKYFKQFTVNHQYRSTISANYVTNLNFATDAQGRPSALDANEVPNWIPKQQINTITITESMAPLIGFDMTVKTKKSNDPQVKVEMKRDRTVALGLSNNQVTENRSNSFVIGTGYKFTEIPNPLAKIKGKKFPLKLAKNTSINLRADLTMRDNVTMIRKITEKQNQITAGQTLWSLKTSADMAVSDKLTIRFFYDHQFNKPKISNSFNNTNINTGIAIRFTLNG